MSKTKPWENDWQLGDRIGQGGQGYTFRARSIHDPAKDGALKHLKNNKSEQARARMRREVVNLEILAKTAAKVPCVLDHNTDRFDTAEVLYVVMEYIPGRTLQEVIEADGPMPLDRAAALVKELAKTVEIAINADIYHRDIKPTNIIVRDLETNDVVMIDYGLSFNSVDDELTKAGETIGNEFIDLPEFHAPGGNRRDPRSDITQLCAVLYYCLTGARAVHLEDANRLPPHKRRGFSLAERFADDPRRRQLEVFFDRGFEVKTDERFQSVKEFCERLDQVLTGNSDEADDDPLAAARRHSQRMLRDDIATHIAKCTLTAQQYLRWLAGKCLEGESDFGEFRVTAKLDQTIAQYRQMLKANPQAAKAHFGGGGFGGGGLGFFNSVFNPLEGLPQVVPKLPDEIEFLGPATFVASVVLPVHQIGRVAVYCIGAKGKQCVLLRHCFVARKSGLSPSRDGIWEPVMWFAGQGDWPLDDGITNVRRWLASAINELGNEIS